MQSNDNSNICASFRFFYSCLWALRKVHHHLLLLSMSQDNTYAVLLEVKFWCTMLIIEAAFHLHNFCIDVCDCSIVGTGNSHPETFCSSYMEYLDPLGDNATLKSKRRAVRQAILQKSKSDG